MAIRALSKIEIDVSRIESLAEAAELAKKHSCAALVVAPDLVSAAILTRGIKQSKYKIIAVVDHPRGDLYGKEKFRGFPVEAMNADGYEILLTAKQQAHEVTAEIKYLSEFCRAHFGAFKEMRFVLDIGQPLRGAAFMQAALTACRHIPIPALVRASHNTKATPTQSGIENLTKQVADLKSICNLPVKVSGNIDYAAYNAINADWFGVSLTQMQAISREVCTPKPKAVAVPLATEE